MWSLISSPAGPPSGKELIASDHDTTDFLPVSHIVVRPSKHTNLVQSTPECYKDEDNHIWSCKFHFLAKFKQRMLSLQRTCS